MAFWFMGNSQFPTFLYHSPPPKIIDRAVNNSHWGLSCLPRTSILSYELILKAKKARDETEAIKSVVAFLKSKESTIKKEVKKFRQTAQKSWEEIERGFFEKLAKLTERPIYSQDFTSYLTHSPQCTLNPQQTWFYTTIYTPDANPLVAHELLHMQFIIHYEAYCREKGLDTNSIQILKEALIFLLNKEFKNLSQANYIHPRIRNLYTTLQKERKKEKHHNFVQFINRAISLTKESTQLRSKKIAHLFREMLPKATLPTGGLTGEKTLFLSY